ncbi:MAG TPA: TetR/AcrR family transcriptional regulator [Hyphomicrobiaceae bacterium]|nr:TetR/AcrR family transcriptional regulator [Hyphomicrobiaceae bacterium]
MHTDDDGSERWIEAGLAELAEGGIDRVRVEVVAGRLGVTKGGFYRRFKDRAALLNAMLDNWSRGRIAVVHQQTALAGLPPRERLKAIVKLYSERVNAQGMAVELAIRQWARSDKLAAASVAQVDAARLKNVAQLYRKLGFTDAAAQERAILFYSFIFGQSLLFLEQAPRKPTSLLAACAEILIETG